jgi:hypothetical protein
MVDKDYRFRAKYCKLKKVLADNWKHFWILADCFVLKPECLERLDDMLSKVMIK